MKILHVVGARPNFMKVAPVMRALARRPGEFEQILVHTGQHYDAAMSAVFFRDLGLPEPDHNLGVGSASHAVQTAAVMQAFEPLLARYQPDWVVVPGDVNSTLACALTAAKLGYRVAHLEAGLRSFDRSMPEELNRVLTDHLADLLFTTEASANANLAREGLAADRVRFVGNTMIDSLVALRPRAEAAWPALQAALGAGPYIAVTLHRPANVDSEPALRALFAALEAVSRQVRVVFPVHPRTRQRLAQLGLTADPARLSLIEPLGYIDFLALETHAALVLTDSGGVQEETTYLGVPCLTLRPNTERPVTVTSGTNRLVWPAADQLPGALAAALQQPHPPRPAPPLWDGRAAERIAASLHTWQP